MSENLNDKTTVAPEVLTTIARLSALEVQGVSRFAEVAGGVNRLFKKRRWRWCTHRSTR